MCYIKKAEKVMQYGTSDHDAALKSLLYIKGLSRYIVCVWT